MSSNSEAIFYDTSRYSLEDYHETNVNTVLGNLEREQVIQNLGGCESELVEFYLDTMQMIQAQYPEFHVQMLVPATIVQVATLRDLQAVDEKLVVVSNTHLIGNPAYSHVRPFQSKVMVDVLQAAAERAQLRHPQAQVAKLALGDFNANPKSEVFKIAVGEQVTTVCEYVRAAVRYHQKRQNLRPDVEIPDVALRCSANLKLKNAFGANKTINVKDADGCEYQCEPYTSFTTMCQDVIDYVLYENVAVVSTLEPISHEDVTREVGLPSSTIPSDHLALVADFEW